jgi:hypothetical protein
MFEGMSREPVTAGDAELDPPAGFHYTAAHQNTLERVLILPNENPAHPY